MQSLAIPRGQVVLASGTAGRDDKRISVEARRGDTRLGICSTTATNTVRRIGPATPNPLFNLLKRGKAG